MGLSASSDEWCQKSDYVVNGLNFRKRIIEDVPIWAKNETDIITNFRTVLNCCRDPKHFNFRKETCNLV